MTVRCIDVPKDEIDVFKKLFAAGGHHRRLSIVRSMKADGMIVKLKMKGTATTR